MPLRRKLVPGLGLVVVGAVAGLAVASFSGGGGASRAAKVLGPLPPGYVYAAMEREDRDAIEELFRERHGAEDVAVALVGTPQDLAPVGVTVVAIVLPEPPDPRELAARLGRDVPLVDPRPKTLAGEPVLGHEGDATLTSASLWVRDRLAVVTYGATTVEVDGVLGGLIAAGAWRQVLALR